MRDLLPLLLVCCFIGHIHAAQNDPQAIAIANRVEQFYRKHKDLKTDFTQTFVQKTRHKKKTEQGVLYIMRPNSIRWDYLKPRMKFFVYDGKQASLYMVDDAQVIIDKNFSNNPISQSLSFLWGVGKLQSFFEVRLCKKEPQTLCIEKSCSCLELLPKKAMQEVDHMQLIISNKDYRVHGAILFDPLENQTQFSFSNLKTNNDLNAQWFSLQLPASVSRIEKQ